MPAGESAAGKQSPEDSEDVDDWVELRVGFIGRIPKPGLFGSDAILLEIPTMMTRKSGYWE